MKIKLLDNIKPTLFSTENSVGLDLHSPVEITLHNGIVYKLPLGIAIEPPEGYYCFLMLRSSMGAKGLIIPNGAGVIDPDYRGEICLLVANLNPIAYKIEKGNKVAQLILMPIVKTKIEFVTELSNTERGQGGFGSTGK